jgi:putative DNA-invertase from lambdoid prophage Rac
MLHTLNAENPSRAIAYVRVSSQRQVDEGVSIEAQIKRIREYARYKGMEIDDKDIIIEEGVSGGVPIWERPGGRHLRTRLETGAYPHILTMRLDRMFRLVTDALATVDELADSGISLHVVDMDGEAISPPRNRKGSAKPLKTL